MRCHPRHPRYAGTLLVALFAAACADRVPTLAVPGGASSNTLAAASDAESQRIALAEVTRMVALALDDHGLRQRVKNDMRNSPIREHKLEFRTYLHGESGGILLAKMARASGSSRDAIIALLSSVRPLEFYMPVPEHRETWRGGDDLLVASQIRDGGALRAYTTSGTPVVLSPARAPAIPVLVLTPVETDFSRPLDLSKYRNTRDQGGETIGTYETCDPMTAIVPCTDDGGTSAGPPPQRPSGLYMTYSHIPDTRESWAAGAPEIEYHIQGARYASDWQAGDLACSGESESGYRRFNQDHPDYSGTVLLFTRTQMEEQWTNRGESSNYITVWEDDDDRCTIRSDDQEAFLWAIGSYLGVNATTGYIRGELGCDACGMFVTRTHMAMTLTFLYNALKEDDIIGLVIQKGTNPEYSHIPTDWVILGANARNITGYAQIDVY